MGDPEPRCSRGEELPIWGSRGFLAVSLLLCRCHVSFFIDHWNLINGCNELEYGLTLPKVKTLYLYDLFLVFNLHLVF